MKKNTFLFLPTNLGWLIQKLEMVLLFQVILQQLTGAVMTILLKQRWTKQEVHLIHLWEQHNCFQCLIRCIQKKPAIQTMQMLTPQMSCRYYHFLMILSFYQMGVLQYYLLTKQLMLTLIAPMNCNCYFFLMTRFI